MVNVALATLVPGKIALVDHTPASAVDIATVLLHDEILAFAAGVDIPAGRIDTVAQRNLDAGEHIASLGPSAD